MPLDIGELTDVLGAYESIEELLRGLAQVCREQVVSAENQTDRDAWAKRYRFVLSLATAAHEEAV